MNGKLTSVSFIYPATSPTRYTLSSLPLDCKSKLSSAASWGLVDEVLERGEIEAHVRGEEMDARESECAQLQTKREDSGVRGLRLRADWQT